MKVRVYKNLHKTRSQKEPIYSIQSKVSKGWRLWRHAESVVLRDVVFKINDGSRLSALKKGVKVVHAFVCGDMLEDQEGFEGVGVPVAYDPRKGYFFRREDGLRVDSCRIAVVGPRGIVIY
jgi:hypothetical protein